MREDSARGGAPISLPFGRDDILQLTRIDEGREEPGDASDERLSALMNVACYFEAAHAAKALAAAAGRRIAAAELGRQ